MNMVVKRPGDFGLKKVNFGYLTADTQILQVSMPFVPRARTLLFDTTEALSLFTISQVKGLMSLLYCETPPSASKPTKEKHVFTSATSVLQEGFVGCEYLRRRWQQRGFELNVKKMGSVVKRRSTPLSLLSFSQPLRGN